MRRFLVGAAWVVGSWFAWSYLDAIFAAVIDLAVPVPSGVVAGISVGVYALMFLAASFGLNFALVRLADAPVIVALGTVLTGVETLVGAVLLRGPWTFAPGAGGEDLLVAVAMICGASAGVFFGRRSRSRTIEQAY